MSSPSPLASSSTQSLGDAFALLSRNASQQISDRRKIKKLAAIGFLIFGLSIVIAFAAIFLGTYATYSEFINDPNMKGIAWQIALSNQFHFLTPLFFSNPAIPNNVLSWYYYILNNPTSGATIPNCVYNAAQPTSNAAVCTLYYALTANPQLSIDEGSTSCAGDDNNGYWGYVGCGTAGQANCKNLCAEWTTPGAPPSKAWADFSTYVLPFISILVGIIGIIPKGA